MNRDDFDDEITALYQQRKQQTIAPTTKFSQKSAKVKSSPARVISILVIGCMASFGIMAIISHFSKLPRNTQTTATLGQTVNLVDMPPKGLNEKELIVLKPLPPKPESISPVIKQTLQPSTTNNKVLLAPSIDNETLVSVMSLPPLSEPKLTIEPSYKVLPEHPINSSQARRYGEIQLSYQIDDSGKVKNIEIISSEVDRGLQRSAKKALSQWLYKPSSLRRNKNHQVVFNFTAPDSK